MFDYSKLPHSKIICVDMRSFFASCSCVNLNLDPLETHLAVVGSKKHKGSVVLASSPKMKSDFGIKTGSRLYEIPDDPRIILVEPEMRTYTQISAQLVRLFNRYAPKNDIYVYSVDESFLNLDGTEGLFGSVEEICDRIQDDIYREFGLPCCIGVGPNMLLAKIALDVEAKQQANNTAVWGYEDVKEKLWPISPLREVWGIGARLEKRLNNMGLYCVGDIANCELKRLEKEFGVMGKQLYHHAWGVDGSKIGTPATPKSRSIGHSQMLRSDLYDVRDVETAILEMCDDVARRARNKNLAGRTINLGIRYSRKVNEKGFQAAKTIDEPTNITQEIYKVCKELLKENHKVGTPVRQLAVRLSKVEADSGVVQLDLFDTKKDKQKDIGFAVDAIKAKFGRNSVLRAVSLKKNATARYRNGLIGGHKA